MANKEDKIRKAEYNKRLSELHEIRSKLECAYTAFDYVTQPDMMDACIFEINALKSRYNYAVCSLRDMLQ